MLPNLGDYHPSPLLSSCSPSRVRARPLHDSRVLTEGKETNMPYLVRFALALFSSSPFR